MKRNLLYSKYLKNVMQLYDKENKPVVFLSIFQMLNQFSINIIVPFFSIILLSSGWSEIDITYFFSIGALAVFLFAPVFGKISDFYSKKSIMIYGLFTQALFFMIYYFFIENVALIYIARIFEMIGFIAITVVGISTLEDIIKKRRGFWTGIFMSLGTAGALLGPLIAGYISEYFQERLLFILGAIASTIALIFLMFIPIRTTQKNPSQIKFKEVNPLAEIQHFIEQKKMRGMAILGLLMNAKNQIFIIFFPIYVIQTLELSESYLGILLTIPIIMHLFQSPLGKITDTITTQFGILTGVFVSSFALFFLPYIHSHYMLILMLLIIGLGSSLWNVSAWSLMGDYAKKNNVEGEVTGTYFSISKLGAFIATLISTVLLLYLEIEVIIQVFAIIVLLSIPIVYLLFKPIFVHSEIKEEVIQHFK